MFAAELLTLSQVTVAQYESNNWGYVRGGIVTCHIKHKHSSTFAELLPSLSRD